MIQLGTNSLGIGLAIHLRDHFTAKARGIESEFQRLHGSATKVMQDNLRVARGVGVGMVAAGVGMTMGFGKALRTASDFQHVMKSVELITGANNQQLAEFDRLATQLGTNTIFSPQQVAGAMEFLARAGFKANHILGGTIQAVTYLGAALDKPIEGKGGVADQIAHIMQGFNIGPKGVGFVADMITKTALSSSSDLEDIHEALKYVSATAVDLKIELPEVLAMVAKLSNAGLRGGIGGRSLNNMLLQFSRSIGDLASDKHKQVLAKLGISKSDLLQSNGEFKRMSDILALLDNRLGKLSGPDRVSTMADLLNIRGARAIGPLLRSTEVGGSFDSLLQDILGSTGTAQNIAIQRMSTLWGSFERLKDTVWNFFKTVGSVLAPVFQPILDMTIVLIAKFTDFIQTPLGKPFVILAAVVGVALVVMGSLLVAFTTIKLVSLKSIVSFVNMGRSLVLAWNQGTAAALRYMTTAKGAMMVNTPFGPRWKSLTTGRFTKPPVSGVGLGLLGSIRLFVSNLFSVNGALRTFGTLVKGVLGPIAFVVGILSALVGFKNVIKLVVFGLGTLLNAILFAGRSIWAIISNPFNPAAAMRGIQEAKEGYTKGQSAMMESLGLKKMEGGLNLKAPKSANQQREEDQLQRILDSQRESSNKKTTVINLDGKKVGEITQAEKNQFLKQNLEALSN